MKKLLLATLVITSIATSTIACEKEDACICVNNCDKIPNPIAVAGCMQDCLKMYHCHESTHCN